ncbi:MAG: hypothetical protein JXM79_11035 [Sedimentisphaerales bacterium]|nr:hypothetical protein [Sedimentisphaerales bacterium]
MANEVTETQFDDSNKLISKNIKLTTSMKMWRAFESYWRSRGKTTLVEGLRTAMEDATNSSMQSQT